MSKQKPLKLYAKGERADIGLWDCEYCATRGINHKKEKCPLCEVPRIREIPLGQFNDREDYDTFLDWLRNHDWGTYSLLLVVEPLEGDWIMCYASWMAYDKIQLWRQYQLKEWHKNLSNALFLSCCTCGDTVGQDGDLT